MSTPSITLWGIHSGETGDAESLFFQNNLLALGWQATGDLSKLKPDREEFKALLSKSYPDMKPGAIPVNGGQLYRFIHELKAGDVVLYPSMNDRMIHYAKVVGGYVFKPAKAHTYPHQRAVKWIKSVPRTQFSLGALQEVGAGMSFFQVKNYAEEYLTALESQHLVPQPRIDPTVKQVAKDIEVTTRDFVLKRLSLELKGLPLEGFEPPIIKVQVKSSDETVTDKDVSALFGKLSAGEYGLFVTLGTYSPQSRNYEQGKANLRLIDGEELVDLIFQHYERFDSRYKGILPLKRVYVPESMEREEVE